LGSIQYQSSPEKNLLVEGFHAHSAANELRAAPGTRMYVTIDVADVTRLVIDEHVDRLAGQNRIKAIEANQSRIISECERDVGHHCSIHEFYGALEFRLIKQLEIRDIRLVHAPPLNVGKFGGETDNWMWPRHTGDYSFYRAYVGKDGKPADYEADNVAYAPRHYLKLAGAGVREGDFVMTAGYPGRTNRHRLPSEIAFTFEWIYPLGVELANEQLAIIERETKGRENAGIAYAGITASIANFRRHRQGQLAQYRSSKLLERRQLEVTQLKQWALSDPVRKHHGADVSAAEQAIAARDELAKQEFLVAYSTPKLLDTARMLYHLAHERARSHDGQRKPGFQERDWTRLRQQLELLDKRYDPQVDKALVCTFLQRYLNQPATTLDHTFLKALKLKPGMKAEQIRSRLDVLYAGTSLHVTKERMAWFDRDVSAFRRTDDLLIATAVALYDNDIRREERSKQLNGDVHRTYTGYMRALLAWKASEGRPIYPDANGTLRVSYGKVSGRTNGSLDGTAWNAFTTLRGLAAKHTGEGDFAAPAAAIEAIENRMFGSYFESSMDSVPVNFLATLDVAGGSSGSPILNGHGELVGLVFDATLDSVISDWDFNPTATRVIAVDYRYMLWQLDVVDGADSLLREIGVHRAEPAVLQ
jgi:hypothetical protein